MAKLPFSREEVRLARLLAARPDAQLNPKLATLIGQPEKAWDPKTDQTLRQGMRGFDNTDTE